MLDHTRPSVVSIDELNEFIGGVFAGNSNSCEELTYGNAVAVMFPHPNTLRPGKIISGPTVFGVCDAALFYAALSCTSFEPMTLTSEMSIRFLRPARGEAIRARGTVHTVAGRNIVGTVVAWTTDESKPVAVAQGTYVRPKQDSSTVVS